MSINHRLSLLLGLCLALTFSTRAQILQGVVQDAVTHAPLPFANVFLNNTTKGTTTDDKGEFILKVLQEPGNYELVVSYVGYESYKSRVTLSENETVSATVLLAPTQTELQNVEVKATRDKVWEKQLKKFKKVFIGDDKLADLCQITNPWVIDFAQEKSGKLQAFASEPIEIDNNGMGYKLLFDLKYFWTDRTGYFIAGNVLFAEKQSSDEKQVMQWQMNRKVSYLRSHNHLFKAIVDHRIGGEGFLLYSEGDNAPANVRSPYFQDDLGKITFPFDTSAIVKPARDGKSFVITMKGRVEVHYKNQNPPVPTYRDVPYAVSWIRLSSNTVVVRKDGYEVNPADVTVSGDMSTSRVSRMLPIDYKPTEVIAVRESDTELLEPLRERIYVHTNKPYYYSGEPLWFKGYVKYTNPSWRDSLSRTAYVELISPERKIVASKVLEIDGGSFFNDFILPNTLVKGTYYLRAYTNFNRNYGDSSLFVRPVPILGDNEAARAGVADIAIVDSTFYITSDKPTYQPREKITLTINTFDEDDVPVSGNVSLSVTDEQVASVTPKYSIVKDYLNDNKAKSRKLEFGFPVEFGFNFSGRFLNNSGKGEMTLLNGVQLNNGNILFAQSDEKGLFTVKGLTHYDTAVFLLKSEKAIDKQYGKIELISREPAPMDFEPESIDIPLMAANSEKRMITEYEVPKDVHLLKEVSVKAARIGGEEEYVVKRPYGKADYILTAKDINASYGNLLLTLPGKVPGLIVRLVQNRGEAPKWMVYLQRMGSFLSPAEVLVTVNDVIMTGTPAQILGSIDPTTVETIEVKNGINVLYGSAGGNGIVSVYTRNDVAEDKMKKDPLFSQVKVPGYSPTRSFRSPDYSDPSTDRSQEDVRSTIYWNPNITTDLETGRATVSFYAADIEGNYRIIAEGMSDKGIPLHCEFVITIAK